MNIKYLTLYLTIFFTFTLSGCSDDEPDEDTINRMKGLVHTVSKNFNSQWKEVNKNSDIVTYIHPDMIFQDEKKNWIREAVVLTDFVSNNISKKFRSATSEMVFDCQSWKYKYKAMFQNKSPMARSSKKTDIVRAQIRKDQKDWLYPMSSSAADNIMKNVCNYDKPRKREVFLDFRWEDMMKLRKLSNSD